MERNMASYDTWVGCDAYDADSNRLGEIGDVFYDDVTGRPEWVSVKAGLFKGYRLVPIAGATLASGPDDDETHLILAYDKDMIRDAPDIDEDGHLAPEQEQELYRYYGFNWNQGTEAEHYGYGAAWHTPRIDKDYTFTAPTVAAGTKPAARLRRYMIGHERRAQ